MQSDTRLPSSGVSRTLASPDAAQLDEPSIALPRRMLTTLVRKLMAAHRARQKAAVARALRSGLAAID